MKSGEKYVPDRGDLLWLSFSPQKGHEQAGRRPAVCLSPSVYNGKTGLGLFCPVTTKIKGYPFEVQLPKSLPVKGVILADQIRNLDWRARKAEFITHISRNTLEEILEKIAVLLFD